MNSFCSIPTSVNELKKGKMLIVVDNPYRENQGDIVFPAETITTEKVNFAMKECRGLFCTTITKMKSAQLDIPLMVSPIDNTEKLKCNFTVTVDARTVTSFGISASDRAKTVKVIASSQSKPSDLLRPGHVYPIIGADGGVLERDGHTEATIELARLAEFAPVNVLCEIIRDDGKVARLPDLIKFSQKFNLKIVSISDLVKYIKAHPWPTPKNSFSVVKKASSILPTEYGIFKISVYKSLIDSREHTVLSMGMIRKEPVLVRIHSQCLTGDTLLSLKCDCREQLHQSMKIISQNKSGLIIYLNQEGRGIGLSNKIKAYELQDKGLDTVEANHALGLPKDARDYKISAEILKDLGISDVILLTNNSQKSDQLIKYGMKVSKILPLEIAPNHLTRKYLVTKKIKLKHLLTQV